jgi:major membrane immunogen (membrane-anchored lipoprotein)
MKPVINFIITLAAVTLLVACGNTQKPGEADPHAGHNHAAGEGHGAAIEKAATGVTLKDDKLNAVYQHYIHLTTALVNSDMAEAKVAVNAIELGSRALTNGSTLTALAAKIGAAADLETQRTLFSDLSRDFIARVKSSGLSSGELYVEYCPMALNDKGASWLSNQKEIRNPYFGESMMTCGEVKETIK